MRIGLLARAILALLPLAAANFAVKPIGQMRKDLKASEALENEYDLALSSRSSAINAKKLYPPHFFDCPIDHFHNESRYEPHSSGTFKLRYWFDASHYKEGGPVFVLESGETSGVYRLPFLRKGLIAQLAQENNGLAVVIEHRYYGQSFPTPDLSVENLRFLTTDQAMVDVVYFAENIVFPGLENMNLTASNVPWIAYGGSYAGAFVAFLRTQYPGTFFGAISSSGVTKAIYNYWAYYEPIKQYAPADCVSTTQALTHAMDNILIKYKGSSLVTKLKSVFGMTGITSYQDFMNTLSYGIGGWQSLNWDPAVSDNAFYEYCDAITANSVKYPATAQYKSDVQMLLTKGGYGSQLNTYTNRMLNWIGYANVSLVQPCVGAGETLDECYSTQNQTFYDGDSLADNVWRSWPWQYCDQWGFLQTGSGVPSNQLPLISRTITLDYTATVCRDAFNRTTPSDVEAINSRGGYHVAYPRLAIIGGQWDPWRPTTPYADAAQPWPQSTADEPRQLIPKAIHHWDENGLFPNETTATLPPASIVKVQSFEATFVREWLSEYYPG